MPIATLITPLAGFALGFALVRANSCTVASTKRLICDGKTDWLIGLLVAISWSGISLVAVAALMPGHVRLPAQIPLGGYLILGSVLLGVGATINQGCFLGSISQFGRGNFNYLFTLLGIALALAWANHGDASTDDISAAHIAPRIAIFANPVALLFVPFALYGVAQFIRSRKQTMLALIGVGVSGGMIYAMNPDWSYTALLSKLVRGDYQIAGLKLELGAAAMFAGAFWSSFLAHTFNCRWPTVRQGAGCFLGGLLMGVGAGLIPGGNDSLMLWAIPGLTLYGPVAYLIMIITIGSVMFFRNYFAFQLGRWSRSAQ